VGSARLFAEEGAAVALVDVDGSAVEDAAGRHRGDAARIR